MAKDQKGHGSNKRSSSALNKEMARKSGRPYMEPATKESKRLIHQAGEAGFTIQFNINGQIGACDLFNVFKMVPVDMKAGAN